MVFSTFTTSANSVGLKLVLTSVETAPIFICNESVSCDGDSSKVIGTHWVLVF